jgi:uncharacterized membrane protein YkoI
MQVSHISIVAAVLLSSAASLHAADKQRPPKHLTLDQAVTCMKHALGAKAGNIRELEAKVDNNRTLCEVEIVDANGRTFEVYVDVAAGKVLRVED